MMGLALGTVLSSLLIHFKSQWRVRYVDREERYHEFNLNKGDDLEVQFEFETDQHLAPSMPSELYVGRLMANGRWQSLFHLEKADLMHSRTKLGPFADTGKYELRGALYYCVQIGDAECSRRLIVVNFTIGEDTKSLKRTYVLPIPK